MRVDLTWAGRVQPRNGFARRAATTSVEHIQTNDTQTKVGPAVSQRRTLTLVQRSPRG